MISERTSEVRWFNFRKNRGSLRLCVELLYLLQTTWGNRRSKINQKISKIHKKQLLGGQQVAAGGGFRNANLATLRMHGMPWQCDGTAKGLANIANQQKCSPGRIEQILQKIWVLLDTWGNLTKYLALYEYIPQVAAVDRSAPKLYFLSRILQERSW